MWVPFHITERDFASMMGVQLGWYIRNGVTVDTRKIFKTHRQAWAVCRRLNREN